MLPPEGLSQFILSPECHHRWCFQMPVIKQEMQINVTDLLGPSWPLLSLSSLPLHVIEQAMTRCQSTQARMHPTLPPRGPQAGSPPRARCVPVTPSDRARCIFYIMDFTKTHFNSVVLFAQYNSRQSSCLTRLVINWCTSAVNLILDPNKTLRNIFCNESVSTTRCLLTSLWFNVLKQLSHKVIMSTY